MTNRDDRNIFSGTLTQLFAAVSGTLIAISDGMNYGWTAPMALYLTSPESHIPCTEHDVENLELILTVGALLGLPITIYLVNKIGRKYSLIVAAIVNLIAWLVVGTVSKLIYIQIARAFFGVTGNMSFVAGPMYIAEIADHKIRGFLSSIIYIMMLVGFVIMYSVGPYTPFYVSPLIAGILMIINIGVFAFMPESPYYLILKNKYDKAKSSLEYLRPKRDISKELEEITSAVERQKTEKGRIQDLFLVRNNQRALLIVCTLNFCQHMGAISVILMNFHFILESAGSIYIETSIAAIIFSVIMLLSASYASFQVDKYGRKALLIISSISTGLCLLTLAVYFNLKHTGYDVEKVSWMPVVSVMIYAAVFKFGLGIVPIIITAEIFSTKMKAIGMTLSDGIYIIAETISLKLYLVLKDAFDFYVPFYVFTVGSFFMAIFTIFFIPETKGRTLEEIQMLLKGKKYLEEYKQKEQIDILLNDS